MNKVKLGSVSMVRNGDNAYFECECGETETVVGYENGAKPKKFEWRGSFNSEHSACDACRTVHEGNMGQKLN